MPVRWSISHREKLVVAISEGELGHAALADYIGSLKNDGATAYRKLFDMTSSTVGLTAQEAGALGGLIVGIARTAEKIGAVAIVVGSDLAFDVMSVFERHAVANRPLRIFRDVVAARTWLDQFAEPTG